jgi:hypothetical protein
MHGGDPLRVVIGGLGDVVAGDAAELMFVVQQGQQGSWGRGEMVPACMPSAPWLSRTAVPRVV